MVISAVSGVKKRVRGEGTTLRWNRSNKNHKNKMTIVPAKSTRSGDSGDCRTSHAYIDHCTIRATMNEFINHY